MESKRWRVFALEDEEIYSFIYVSMAESRLIDLVGLTRDPGLAISAQTLSTCRPDVIVRGTSRLDNSDFEELAKLRGSYPDSGMVLLLGSCQKEQIDKLREIAARGEGGFAISLRQSLHRTEQLLGIIAAAASGQTIFDPVMASLMLAPEPESPFLKQLTTRETEILRLLAMAYTNNEIGEALCIDIKTVEHHLNNVYSKLKTTPEFGNRHPRVAAAIMYLQGANILVA